MPSKPRRLPADVELRVTLPAPMLWKLDEIAEEQYGIRADQLALLLIARGLRKPRGPQTDLSKDWEIYQLWRRRLPITKIAEIVKIVPRTVSTRLQAMGLRSVYEDYRKGNAAAISQKGWETRRAKRAALQEQARIAEQQLEEQLNGEAERKKSQADERRRQRERQHDAAREEDAA